MASLANIYTKEKLIRLREVVILLHTMHEYCYEHGIPYTSKICQTDNGCLVEDNCFNCKWAKTNFLFTYSLQCPLCKFTSYAETSCCEFCPWYTIDGLEECNKEQYKDSFTSMQRCTRWISEIDNALLKGSKDD